MERLTRRNEQNTGYYYPKCFEECDGMSATDKCNTCNFISDVCEKLGQYEDAEEQGILFKLPCKEGDTVYTIDSYIDCCNEECKLTKEECDECSDYKRFYSVKETKFQIQMIAQLGRVLFLTKEEAEQKLREL